MNRKKRILLVEDDVDVGNIIRDYLEDAFYEVCLKRGGSGVIEYVQKHQPDLLVLDIMLPGVDGKTLCREIRSFSSVPIVMMTAVIDEVDRLVGYELGADDYICKPVSPREVLARVKTVLRRGSTAFQESVHNLRLDGAKRVAIYKGEVVHLTSIEFRLLKLLSDSEGIIFSREKIIELLYDNDDGVSGRTIDTYIKKLRQKLETERGSAPIHSIYGEGYKYQEL